MKVLTVGTAVYKDFSGLYFTIQGFRLMHQEALPEIEFLVVDNAPNSPEGNRIKNFVQKISSQCDIRYIPLEEPVGTSPSRNKLFEEARTPWVLVIDSHVFVVPGAISKLISYLKTIPDSRDLFSGPLLHDDFTNYETHFVPKWRGGMLGIWGRIPLEDRDPDEPIEIPAMGLGLFVMRKDAWPGFHPDSRGFGGEEVYIHEKVRRNGGACYCLPYLKWVHRFNEASDIKYPLKMWDRIRNYVLEYEELNWDINEVKDYFVGQGFITEQDWGYLMENPRERLNPPSVSAEPVQATNTPLLQNNTTTTAKPCCPGREKFETMLKLREPIFNRLFAIKDWSEAVEVFGHESSYSSLPTYVTSAIRDATVIYDFTNDPTDTTLMLIDYANSKASILAMILDPALFRELLVLSSLARTTVKKDVRFVMDHRLNEYEVVIAPDVFSISVYISKDNLQLVTEVCRNIISSMPEGIVIFNNKDQILNEQIARIWYDALKREFPNWVELDTSDSTFIIWTSHAKSLSAEKKDTNTVIVLDNEDEAKDKAALELKTGQNNLKDLPENTIKQSEVQISDLASEIPNQTKPVAESVTAPQAPETIQSQEEQDQRIKASLLNQVVSYSKSIIGRLTGANKRVPDEIAEQRWQICKSCPERLGNRCKVCGCFLKGGILGDGKVYWSKESCPLNKWSAIETDEH